MAEARTYDDNAVDVDVCHDRKGVRLLTRDDVVDMRLPAARELIAALSRAVKVAEGREPPAPEPLDWSKEYPNDKNAKEFASVGPWNHGDGCIYVAGFEVGLDGAAELRDFLTAAIKYHAAPEEPT